MSIINNLNLQKTDKMMEEEQFWAIVAISLKNTSSQEEQAEFLIDQLVQLSPEEMIGFRLRTDKLLYDSYTSELWCAAYIMNMGCSDDGFEYFRNWVISRGKYVYHSAKENPDSLVNEVREGTDFYEFESFWFVALEAFQRRTNQNLYDYINYDEFLTREGNYPQFDFNWNEDDPESMRKICPKLFNRLWK